MATTSKYGTGPGETTFDYAWQGHRQTGSAFKVFSLMTLIHDYDGDPNRTYYTSKLLPPGWLPGYPTYSVHTAELSYQGTISVTRATTDSDNTVFAQLAQDLTLPKVSATAHAMGITSSLTNYPSEALGAVSVSPLEMADAYATIASGGIHHPPTAITKVVFPDGSVVNMGSPAGNRVFSEGESYAATQVLKTVIQSGTGTAANYGCPAAGKTGTTSSFTDAYFDGYSPKLATAVWVGYPNATESMANGFGGTLAAPIWHDFMSAASDGYCGDFTVPSVLWHGTQFVGSFSAVAGAEPVDWFGIKWHDRPGRPRLGRRRHQPGRATRRTTRRCSPSRRRRLRATEAATATATAAAGTAMAVAVAVRPEGQGQATEGLVASSPRCPRKRKSSWKARSSRPSPTRCFA